MKNIVSPLKGDELLVGVFKEFPKGQKFNFKDEIVLVFYKASKKLKYEWFFSNYSFDLDGPKIFSKEIEDAIVQLRNAQLLYEIDGLYQISKAVDIRFKKFIAPKLDEDKVNLLKELSNEIKECLL